MCGTLLDIEGICCFLEKFSVYYELYTECQSKEEGSFLC